MIISFAPLTALVLLSFPTITTPYPIITDIGAGMEKCLTYNIPEHDDVHVVFLALPVHESDDIETYYVDAIHSLSESGGDSMLAELPETPSEIKDKIPKKGDGSVMLHMDLGFKTESRKLLYHVPLIKRHIAQSLKKLDRENLALKGMHICFDGSEIDDEVAVLFDVVYVSDESDHKLNKKLEKTINQKEALTPIQENLKDGIRAASDVLSEMGSAGRREFLMRQESNKKNSGLAYFSYLSVSILLATSWVQIKYLKSYFKKKKLM